MTPIPELSPLEQALKFQHIHPGPTDVSALLVPPNIIKELKGDLPKFRLFQKISQIQSINTLEESSFFQSDSDIAVSTHPRYFPAHPHRHQFYEVQYVLSGSCRQIIDERTITLTAGDVCFISPETVHVLEVFNEDTLVINLLIRSSTFRSTFGNLLSQNDIISDFFTKNLYHYNTAPYILCKTNAEPIFTDLIQVMQNECQNYQQYSERLLNGYLELFFIYLLRHHQSHFVIADSTDQLRRENIIEILRYIQKNFRTVSLQETAHHFSYSDPHLSRMIKKYTGQTFSQIVKTIKLQHAANLLSDPAIDISYIIEDSGYIDISHFYKAFKQHYNETPVQYRTRLNNTPEANPTSESAATGNQEEK